MLNPKRYLQQLVLSLDDEGLEDLTLRLARLDFPEAHRVGDGGDGGIDVLSDYENPPARGWQAKNFRKGKFNWDDCRDSLKAAMNGAAVPPHYTFVFPRKLTKGERDFWRDSFLPEQRKKYPSLRTLDYWDDLADRVYDQPELINQLSGEAFGPFFLTVATKTADTGVNPLATGQDLVGDAQAVAEHSVQIGASDPYFAYGQGGREAGAGDEEIPEGHLSFTLRQDQADALPRYAIALREGDIITEITAQPRAGVRVSQPEPWFAETEQGAALRQEARAQLGKGRPVLLEANEHAGLHPGQIPDRFRSLADPNGLLTKGTIELQLSRPVDMTVTLHMPDGAVIPQALKLYRVPVLPGDTVAYAGAVGGTVLTFDFQTEDSEPGEDFRVVGTITAMFSLAGEDPRVAARGLGFAKAFGEAESALFECPDLLPEEGIDEGASPPISTEGEEIFRAAAFVATALALLNDRDGGRRVMPEEVTERDVLLAESIIELLNHGDSRWPMPGERFAVALTDNADLEQPPETLATSEVPIADLCGYPTGLVVEQSLENAKAVQVERLENGRARLICEAEDGQGAVVLRLQAAAA